MEASEKKRIFIMDGNAYIYRAFYAIEELSTSTGIPTNAVFGFLQILHKILSDFSPTHIGVAFDVAKKTFRSDLFPEYKATRRPMPDDLALQIPTIKEILRAWDIPILEMEVPPVTDAIRPTVRTRLEALIETVKTRPRTQRKQRRNE